jgi:hypothetical protein
LAKVLLQGFQIGVREQQIASRPYGMDVCEDPQITAQRPFADPKILGDFAGCEFWR